MESQPRTSVGAEGKSSDDIVYELADSVINTIITFISTEDANIYMFKVVNATVITKWAFKLFFILER